MGQCNKPPQLLSITLPFSANALLHPYQRHGWRAERAMVARSASIDMGRNIELRRSSLRGRRPVRAQSTILYKSHPKTTLAFLHNRFFRTDALFIRSENAVGARSAQSPRPAEVGI